MGEEKNFEYVQRTVGRAVRVEGFGFWTGQDVCLEFVPAEAGSGVRFVRTDLPGSEPIPARLACRVSKPRQTSLGFRGVRVDMVEHVLAAVAACGVDNLEIRVNGPEMPGLDGSSAPFFAALQKARIVSLGLPRPVRVVREPFVFESGSARIEFLPSNGGGVSFGYRLDYPTAPDGRRNPIPAQEFQSALSAETFGEEIAPARTFLLESEAKQLLALGLCHRVSERDVLVFGSDGPIGNRLRFDNEAARHKTLDMIGDFSLAETPIVGCLRGCRSGHQQNADALAEWLERVKPEFLSREAAAKQSTAH